MHFPQWRVYYLTERHCQHQQFIYCHKDQQQQKLDRVQSANDIYFVFTLVNSLTFALFPSKSPILGQSCFACTLNHPLFRRDHFVISPSVHPSPSIVVKLRTKKRRPGQEESENWDDIELTMLNSLLAKRKNVIFWYVLIIIWRAARTLCNITFIPSPHRRMSLLMKTGSQRATQKHFSTFFDS